MRDLKAGDQCEHFDRVGSPHTGYKDVRCETRHQQRVDGKPQQLVLISEGRKSRFVCVKHAPSTSIASTRPKQKARSDHMAQQLDLL